MPFDSQSATIRDAYSAAPLSRAHGAITWIVLTCVYGAWFGLTYYATQLPWWLLAMTGGYVVCLHGSLQHEAVHGHLAGKPLWNTILVILPLGLWIPYTRYRTLHTAHHECSAITDPVEDPESFYLTPEQWTALGPILKRLLMINQTLAGRMLLGPLMLVPAFWYREARRVLGGDPQVAREWLVHLLAAGALLTWLYGVCGLPLWQYLVLFVWPGTALTLMRSFTEHRPGDSNEERTALIEGSPITRLLFLNNNMHLVHHRHPELPWYAIRGLFLAQRSEWVERNGGFYFKSYWEVCRHYLLRPKDRPVHPC